VIDHLGGQAALVIEDQRHAQYALERRADQRALVDVRVDNRRPQP